MIFINQQKLEFNIMKIKHTILAGCLLMMGMASCEMKDEILGNKGESTEMGVMNLDVLVDAKSNDIVTKADGTQDDGEETVPAVSAKGYEVEINNASGFFKKIIYGTEKATVELPVGDYTLYAHAAGEAKETEAYYGGRTTLKIESGKSTDVSVICKMLNTKIQLNYGVELQTAFKKWDITVTAGSKNKVFSCVSTSFSQPDPIFWIMDEGTTEIHVDFKGINSKGNVVPPEKRVITKPALAENKNWLGGDALAINFKPKANPEQPDGVLGIEISAEVKWDGISDSVDVPVVDEPVSPEPPVGPGPEVPEAGAPTITGDCIGKELTYSEGGVAPEVKVNMSVPNKINDVKVQISSTNSDFVSAVASMGLTAEGGSSLITNEILQNAKLFPMPNKGDTEFAFSLSSELLGLLLGFEGTHEFFLTVEDQAGKSAKASFKLTIQPAQAQ